MTYYNVHTAQKIMYGAHRSGIRVTTLTDCFLVGCGR